MLLTIGSPAITKGTVMHVTTSTPFTTTAGTTWVAPVVTP